MDKPAARPEHAHIPGWGADLNLADRPAYPMERTPPRLDDAPGREPTQQPVSVKVFHSTERPGITPIFGTSAPPSGASGRLRSVAYRYSENDLRHWLLLLLADRVNVVEGVASDLAHGHVPNVYREMGGPAEFKHNRAGALRKIAIGSAALALAALWLRSRRQRTGARLR